MNRLRLTLFIICLLGCGKAHSQEHFYGRFMMNFDAPVKDLNDVPLLWNIRSAKEGGKMMMQFQDELLAKGVNKRVIFNPADSTWTMLLSLNTVREGTRVRRGAMFRSPVKKNEFVVRHTKSYRVISGYNCRKTIIESKNYLAELWITDKLNFNLCFIYKLLAHCGMVTDHMRKGDWFMWKNSNGMILEVTSKKKNSDDHYTINISGVKKGKTDDAYFDIKGFHISEIPEGANCGMPVEEK